MEAQKMIYNQDQIQRLVPEAFIPLQMWPNNGAVFVIGDVRLFTHHGPGQLLLDTRRKLEVAMKALEKIKDRDWVENALDPQWAAQVSKQALTTIKELS
jgi:hypothetical protein